MIQKNAKVTLSANSGGFSAHVMGDRLVIIFSHGPTSEPQFWHYKLPVAPDKVTNLSVMPVVSLTTDAGDVWVLKDGKFERVYNVYRVVRELVS